MTPKEAYYKCWENNKRDKNLEKIIIKDPYYAYYYSKDIIKGRWIEAENIIATSSGCAYLYARDVIKGKLPENMHNMTPKEAYYKCLCLHNKQRDELLEKIIIKDPEYSYYYALNVIKGRWLEAEQYIIKDPYLAYKYAIYVIKNRWKEAEPIIMKDAGYAYYYSKDIIKGKLPEHMHNAMILHGLNNDDHAKLYFKFIK